jgi:hypothetical protein
MPKTVKKEPIDVTSPHVISGRFSVALIDRKPPGHLACLSYFCYLKARF